MSDREVFERARETMRRFQHEVRTPLGQIIGYSELLEEELEDRGQADLAPDLQRIRSAAQQLLDLVDGRLRSPSEADETSSAVPPEVEARSRPMESGGEPSDPASPDGEAAFSEGQEGAPRILVVDDDPQNRDLLARRLDRSGFEVETAGDGLDGLRRIDAEPPDLVMLDVMMPGMNGLEVLERIRATRSMAELPVILATGLAETEDAVEGLGRGANDYVTKPFDFPLLIARVRSQLAASRASREVADLVKQLDFRNNFIREALGRDVPTRLLVELAETPDALEAADRTRIVSVLTVDVQASRKLAEQLSPERYVMLLRKTFGGLAEVIERYDGIVDSISGDALVASFGLPEPTEEDTARAAACALALQLSMDETNERGRAAQLPAVEIAIGIATGEVVIGAFGDDEALRFKAIGEPFLEAARIEQGAAAGEVWIDAATRERLGSLAAVDLERPLDDETLSRLIGVGGEWLMSLREVPGAPG